MTKDEILQLSEMARITLTPEEIERLPGEISAILEYVSQIDAAVDSGAVQKKVGVVHNVFREDVVTNTPESHTAALMAEMPETKGRFLQVPKILQQND